MGFEYMFFDEALRGRFVDFASARGVASTVRKDVIAGFVVDLPDGLADELQDAFEAEYDSIMDEQRLLAESDAERVSRIQPVPARAQQRAGPGVAAFLLNTGVNPAGAGSGRLPLTGMNPLVDSHD